MDKLILLSILLPTLVVPAMAARDRNAGRGARRVLATCLGFNLVYVVLISVVYTVFYVPEWFK